jgi:hypothetical protein
MPNRGDFETEFANDGEAMLMEIDFSNDDDQAERDEKIKIIDIYTGKLDERIRRKNFIKDRNLLEYKKVKLYQSEIISVFFRRGCAAIAIVLAALPHKNTSLWLCRKIKTKKRIFIQLQSNYFCMFSLRLYRNCYCTCGFATEKHNI